MNKISNVQCAKRIALNFMTNFEVMLTELQGFIKEHQLFTKDDHLLVAVSGGVDSMTLLHLLVRLEYRVSVAHMNFRLRGEEADKDEKLVRETGNLLRVPVFTKQVNTVEYANEKRISTQMAARELRYRWFIDLLEEHFFDHIATAHNADDNLETVLFNLTKGTGIRGVSGIKHRLSYLVRPLLFAPKADILTYAETKGIQWREDASNADKKYIRNKIRHEVLPVLKEINPSLIAHFENTRSRLLGTEQVLMRWVHEIREKYVQHARDKDSISQEWMTNMASDAVVLSEILRPYGFSYVQCQEIVKASNQIGKLFEGGDYILNVDRGVFLLKRKDKRGSNSTIKIENTESTYQFGEWLFDLSEHPASEFVKRSTTSEIFIDTATVQFPLTLRFWEQGDTFQPLGMKGKKKISDFLVDQKVPLIEKSSVMVLESAGQICWVVNYRLDDRCKVTDKTSKLLKITCQKSFEDGPITV